MQSESRFLNLNLHARATFTDARLYRRKQPAADAITGGMVSLNASHSARFTPQNEQVDVMIAKIPKADAYGGVLVNAKGEVLLREPTGYFGDYAWAFANGKPHKGEKPDQAALRIVREETGYCARIITPIPLAFGGQEPNTLAEGQMMLPGIFTTAFYLMEPLGRH